MRQSQPTTRAPFFSRAALFIAAFLICLLVLAITWLMRDRQWTPTLPLPAVLLTLMFVLPLGEFVRTRFKLSLRSMLVFVAAAAMLFGLFGKRANEARQQRQAVRSVLALKQSSLEFPTPFSDVNYMERNYGGDFIQTRAGWIVPAWLVNVLGKDFFFDVHDISIQNQDLSAADALDGVDLDSFNNVYFSNCKLGANAIRVIASLGNLRELHLVDVGLTDADLQQLSKLQGLEKLNINSHQFAAMPNEITDRGLADIAQFKNLRSLGLANTLVTGSGLVHLRGIANLEFLDMNYDLVTNEDVKQLAHFPALSGASFADTGVNENSMPFFDSLEKLDWVSFTPSSPEIEKRLTAELELSPRVQRPAYLFR